MKRIVVVPTYNESRNIERLIGEILAQGVPGLHVLVVDDRSPDGTSALVTRLAAESPQVLLAERVDDKGRGTAGIVGFDLALRLGADQVAEMDADFSHPPSDLPRLFEGLERADISIASRLAKGSIDLRPAKRRAVTRFANAYARLFLERPSHRSRIRDWTTGFRAYRRAVFEKVPPHTLVSRGPSILQELLYRALNQGCTAEEFGFRMKDREEGVSTFSGKVARQSLLSIPCYRMLFGAGEGKPEFRLASFQAEPQGRGCYRVSRAPGPEREPGIALKG